MNEKARKTSGYFYTLFNRLDFRFGDEGSWRLLGFTVLVVLIIVLVSVCNMYSTEIDTWWDGTKQTRDSRGCDILGTFIKWFVLFCAHWFEQYLFGYKSAY